MQAKSYTVFILSALQKQFAIYTDSKVGQNIQMLLSEKEKPRPYTHDLFNHVLQGFDIKLIQTVIYDVQDTVYFARLFAEQQIGEKKHVIELDARPSDCLTLSLMNDLPIYCMKNVVDQLVEIQES